MSVSKASIKFCLCQLSREGFPAGPEFSLVATKWPPQCGKTRHTDGAKPDARNLLLRGALPDLLV